MTCIATIPGVCAYRGVTDYLQALGARLKHARLAAKLTQQRAAVEAGLDTKTLSLYELGKIGDPGLQKVRRLAELYGVRVEWLVTGDPPMKAGDDAETRVERDDDISDAVAELLASTDADDPLYPTPTEVEWLRGLSFRHLQVAGMRVTPSYLRSTLREKRLQDSGRISRGQRVEADVPENTLDLPDPTPRRKP